MAEQGILLAIVVAIAVNVLLAATLILRREARPQLRASATPGPVRLDPSTALQPMATEAVRSVPPPEDAGDAEEAPDATDPGDLGHIYSFGSAPDRPLDRSHGIQPAPPAEPDPQGAVSPPEGRTPAPERLRSGPPRRFPVVLHPDPHAPRAIASFISDPTTVQSNGPSGRGSGSSSTPPLALAGPSDRATGLMTLDGWNELLADEDARLDRYGRTVSVVRAELAGLDGLTARLGEASADRIVAGVVDILRSEARAADRLAALGRGRFGVLLAETDEGGAMAYAERVRHLADGWLDSAGVSVRFAVGWASPRSAGGVALAARTAEARLRASSLRLEGGLRGTTDTARGGALANGDLERRRSG